MSVENLVSKAMGRIGNVHPVVKQGAEEVIRRAYKQGIYVLFSDGYRSNAEQNKLYAQGRTTKGQIVTNARGGQSLHNYGLALDMFITNKTGATASWNVSELRKVATIAKGLGFEWGGDWTSFKDYPHIQMTGGLSIAQLQAGKKPNISLKGGTTSAPAPSKPATPSKPKSKWTTVTGSWTGQTLKKGHRGNPVTQLQKKLGIKADSYFGEDTYKAVRSAQSKAGITVDGLAGKSTYKILTQKQGSSSKIKANLKVDGKWGTGVTKALQKALGTPVDGIISKQLSNSTTKALYGGVQFGKGGSPLIKALQRKVGAKVDGYLGADTVRKLQSHLGTVVDGKLSRPSLVVKELQKRLNSGKF